MALASSSAVGGEKHKPQPACVDAAGLAMLEVEPEPAQGIGRKSPKALPVEVMPCERKAPDVLLEKQKPPATLEVVSISYWD